MFITKKKHTKILKDLTEMYAERHKGLTNELKEARDLKIILEKITGKWLTGTNGVCINTISGGYDYQLSLNENVLQYAEDILGGRVIKQEGTKALIIDKEGNVRKGLTKQKPDKGYSYKLIRE